MTELTSSANVEDDAMALQNIFAKAANAIVEASNLRREVAQLQSQMSDLSTQVDGLKTSNDRLVDELHQIRNEKAEVQNKLWNAEAEVDNLKAKLEEAARLNSEQAMKIAEAEQTVARLRKENDGWVKAYGEADYHNEALNKHLKRILAHVDRLDSVFSELQSELHAMEASSEPSPLGEVKEDHSWSGSGTETSETSTEVEQPRDEHNRFEPMPMAAKDFEY